MSTALPTALQTIPPDNPKRNLTLGQPDNLDSRKLITASGQYGLTKGSYTAEYLES